jgi:hypothetical protein
MQLIYWLTIKKLYTLSNILFVVFYEIVLAAFMILFVECRYDKF